MHDRRLIHVCPERGRFFPGPLGTGTTAALSARGKIVVIVLMFAGRVGPLSVGTTLFLDKEKKIAEDDPAI